MVLPRVAGFILEIGATAAIQANDRAPRWRPPSTGSRPPSGHPLPAHERAAGLLVGGCAWVEGVEVLVREVVDPRSRSHCSSWTPAAPSGAGTGAWPPAATPRGGPPRSGSPSAAHGPKRFWDPDPPGRSAS